MWVGMTWTDVGPFRVCAPFGSEPRWCRSRRMFGTEQEKDLRSRARYCSRSGNKWNREKSIAKNVIDLGRQPSQIVCGN